MNADDVLDALPQARGARLAAIGVAALVALLLIGFLAWWLLIRPRAAQVAAATARVEAATAAGTAEVAKGTLGITLDVNQRNAAVDITTAENARVILSSPGASTSIGADLDRAGRSAVCLRAAYQYQPECAALRRDGRGERAADGDARSGPAGE